MSVLKELLSMHIPSSHSVTLHLNAKYNLNTALELRLEKRGVHTS